MIGNGHILAMVIAMFISAESKAQTLTTTSVQTAAIVPEPAAAAVLMLAGGAMTLRRPSRFLPEGGFNQ